MSSSIHDAQPEPIAMGDDNFERPTADRARHIEKMIRQTTMLEANMITKQIEENLFGDQNNPLISRLPENIFVGYFLPMFSGQIDDVDTLHKRLKEWYSIAGSPQGRVNIIDNLGRLLFTTPPVFCSESFNSLSENNGSMYTLRTFIEQSALASSVMPAMAMNIANDFLPHLTEEIKQRPALSVAETYRSQWVEIFTRYNVVNQEPTSSTSSIKEQTTSSDDDLVFYD